jgi:hypothetical protein
MTDEEFDKEIGRREAESPFKAMLFASREANRARSEEARLLKEVADKDAEIEALKADVAVLAEALGFAQNPHSRACKRQGTAGQQVRPCPCGLDALLAAPRPGSSLTALRQQVATLIAGQQSAGARQQAFYELASDLAAMTPEGRDTTIRRIIDQRDNS